MHHREVLSFQYVNKCLICYLIPKCNSMSKLFVFYSSFNFTGVIWFAGCTWRRHKKVKTFVPIGWLMYGVCSLSLRRWFRCFSAAKFTVSNNKTASQFIVEQKEHKVMGEKTVTVKLVVTQHKRSRSECSSPSSIISGGNSPTSVLFRRINYGSR